MALISSNCFNISLVFIVTVIIIAATTSTSLNLNYNYNNLPEKRKKNNINSSMSSSKQQQFHLDSEGQVIGLVGASSVIGAAIAHACMVKVRKLRSVAG
jgi:hypothetical protein